MEERNYSDETARIIDQEVKLIIEDAYTRAKELLNKNLDKLKTLSKALLEKEVLGGEEVKRLLGFVDQKSVDQKSDDQKSNDQKSDDQKSDDQKTEA